MSLAQTSNAQVRLMKNAAKSRDGTILAIGFGRHNPYAEYPSFSANSASALVKRGLLEFVKNAAWGSVYRITAQGRVYVNSLPPHLKDHGV